MQLMSSLGSPAQPQPTSTKLRIEHWLVFPLPGQQFRFPVFMENQTGFLPHIHSHQTLQMLLWLCLQ
jgi:hypothetical protein